MLKCLSDKQLLLATATGELHECTRASGLGAAATAADAEAFAPSATTACGVLLALPAPRNGSGVALPRWFVAGSLLPPLPWTLRWWHHGCPGDYAMACNSLAADLDTCALPDLFPQLRQHGSHHGGG